MARTAVLGLPRVGPDRELKFALEAHWAGRTGAARAARDRRALRAAGWERAPRRRDRRDPVAATSASTTTCSTPPGRSARSRSASAAPDAEGLDAYFAMARGDGGARPLEMTKWFDTNYHYLVPELGRGQALPAARRPLARAARARPPRSASRRGRWCSARSRFLLLSQGPRPAARRARRARAGVRELLARARRGGRARGAARRAVPGARPHGRRARRDRRGARARWPRRSAPRSAWRPTSRGSTTPSLERVAGAAAGRARTSTSCARRDQLAPALAALAGARRALSLGVVDGRNVWAADLDRALDGDRRGGRGARRRPRHDRPVVLAAPRPLRRGARDARSTAEVRAVAGVRAPRSSTSWRRWPARPARPASATSCWPPRASASPRARDSPRTNDPAVRARARRPCADDDHDRAAPVERAPRGASASASRLPELPTTTIGSFPQTDAIRAARRRPARGRARRRPTTHASSRSADRRGRRRPGASSASTCSCTASPSATTWSSTSASSSRGFAFSDARLGAVLRQPLRQAADPLRRRLAARADDRRAGGATPSRSPTGR